MEINARGNSISANISSGKLSIAKVILDSINERYDLSSLIRAKEFLSSYEGLLQGHLGNLDTSIEILNSVWQTTSEGNRIQQALWAGWNYGYFLLELEKLLLLQLK